MTHFYNHLGDGRNGRVIDKLCYNIAADIATWGNYDDEVNQLNQALYNIQNSGQFLPKSIPNSGALPVSIVGAGPSLDETLLPLKQLQSRSFIISCGPALSVSVCCVKV